MHVCVHVCAHDFVGVCVCVLAHVRVCDCGSNAKPGKRQRPTQLLPYPAWCMDASAHQNLVCGHTGGATDVVGSQWTTMMMMVRVCVCVCVCACVHVCVCVRTLMCFLRDHITYR